MKFQLVQDHHIEMIQSSLEGCCVFTACENIPLYNNQECNHISKFAKKFHKYYVTGHLNNRLLMLMDNNETYIANIDDFELLIYSNIPNHYYSLNSNYLTHILNENGVLSILNEVDDQNIEEVLMRHFYELNIVRNEVYKESLHKLLGRSIDTLDQYITLTNHYEKLLKSYQNLRSSKLGSMQIKVWEAKK